MIRGIRDIKNLNSKKTIMNKIEIEQEAAINAKLKTINYNNIWWRLRQVASHILDFAFILISVFLIMKDQVTIETFLIIFFNSSIKTLFN